MTTLKMTIEDEFIQLKSALDIEKQWCQDMHISRLKVRNVLISKKGLGYNHLIDALIEELGL